MNPNLMNQPLQDCPQCGVKVKSLEKHLKKAHNPAKLAEREKKAQLQRSVRTSQRNFEVVEKARQLFLATKIQCTVCQESVVLKLISEHFYVKHKSSLPPEMRALYGLAEAKNMFKSSKEREDFWRKTNGYEARGSDIYDRGMVVQGGAFGLGKSRKH